MKRQQSGFTLVEIAIVMVIIGLLLGGVLKGQEVITNAKIKNINNDYSGISAAIYSYQDRYAALPGDDPAPGAHVENGVLADDSAGTAGDGLIDGNWQDNGSVVAVVSNPESALAWHHMRAAGLLSGDRLSSLSPTHAFGGVIGIQTGANQQDAGLNNLDGIVIVFDNMSGEIAAILDSQNDDGDPNEGSIREDSGIGGAGLYLFGGQQYQIAFAL